MIVVYDVAQMVASAVVGFADAHGVVGEVDIAVVALVWELVGVYLGARGLYLRTWELGEGGELARCRGNLQKSARNCQYSCP